VSLVEAAKYYNSFEAGLAQSRLEEAGIDSVLFDLEMATYGIGLSIPVRLMVLDDDLQIAIEVLMSPA
jgi:Putative prokaryotic signal transducing protein